MGINDKDWDMLSADEKLARTIQELAESQGKARATPEENVAEAIQQQQTSRGSRGNHPGFRPPVTVIESGGDVRVDSRLVRNEDGTHVSQIRILDREGGVAVIIEGTVSENRLLLGQMGLVNADIENEINPERVLSNSSGVSDSQIARNRDSVEGITPADPNQHVSQNPRDTSPGHER